MTAPNIIDITLENAQQVIIEGSKQRLVIVDFWADWCEPCKQLMPILEKIAREHPDSITLAKVNCDEQQQLAMQFGVRSLPTVALFKDGQPVDGFAGVESESQILARLQPHLPNPADDDLRAAEQALQQEDFDTAYALAKQVNDIEPERADAKLILASAAVQLGRLSQAEELLNSIGMADQHGLYQHVKAQIELAAQAADSPELQALVAAVEAAPEDAKQRLQLAAALHQAHRSDEALAHIFSILSHDINATEAKQQALSVINALPSGDPLAARYRRKLYSMLY